jgi:hypothetical protein
VERGSLSGPLLEGIPQEPEAEAPPRREGFRFSRWDAKTSEAGHWVPIRQVAHNWGRSDGCSRDRQEELVNTVGWQIRYRQQARDRWDKGQRRATHWRGRVREVPKQGLRAAQPGRRALPRHSPQRQSTEREHTKSSHKQGSSRQPGGKSATPKGDSGEETAVSTGSGQVVEAGGQVEELMAIVPHRAVPMSDAEQLITTGEQGEGTMAVTGSGTVVMSGSGLVDPAQSLGELEATFESFIANQGFESPVGSPTGSIGGLDLYDDTWDYNSPFWVG